MNKTVNINENNPGIYNKEALLQPQLQEELTSGQVIEIQTILDNRKTNLVIAFNRDLNRWLIVHFFELIEKKK